jgi:cysteine-rich repeat protein
MRQIYTGRGAWVWFAIAALNSLACALDLAQRRAKPSPSLYGDLPPVVPNHRDRFKTPLRADLAPLCGNGRLDTLVDYEAYNGWNATVEYRLKVNEVCDDGNRLDGDGCAADCASLDGFTSPCPLALAVDSALRFVGFVDAETLVLVTADLNSWATMRFWVEELKADVALLQETRVPPAGLAAARAQARDAGWTGVWEAAVPGELGGPASGGLAVLVRGGRRIARVPAVGRHPHRWLHTVVEAAEGRPLHVATVYGYDAGQPGAPGMNADLISDILEAMAELGQAQWVIGGDWNEEADAIWEQHQKLHQEYFRY